MFCQNAPTHRGRQHALGVATTLQTGRCVLPSFVSSSLSSLRHSSLRPCRGDLPFETYEFFLTYIMVPTTILQNFN